MAAAPIPMATVPVPTAAEPVPAAAAPLLATANDALSSDKSQQLSISIYQSGIDETAAETNVDTTISPDEVNDPKPVNP
jgi:hypothetical protein